MIQRSVPGYQTIINHTGELAERFVQEKVTAMIWVFTGRIHLAYRERIENAMRLFMP
jgi:hypothetical protein